MRSLQGVGAISIMIKGNRQPGFLSMTVDTLLDRFRIGKLSAMILLMAILAVSFLYGKIDEFFSKIIGY